MKQIYSFILVLLTLTATAQRRTLMTAISNGNWSNKSSWSLNRVPQDADSILIPLGKTITLDKNDNLNNVYIIVKGTLVLRKKLTLDNQSTVAVITGGSLSAFGADRTQEVISLGGQVKFDQRSTFFVSGPSYANTSTFTAPNGFAFGNLSVKYTAFTAIRKNNMVELNWSTANETENSHFEVERSFDGRSWNTIGEVKGNGTTNLTKHYNYVDKKVEQSIVHYRLRQVDLDGKSEYSTIKTINNNNEANAVSNIFASSRQQISVDLNNEVKGQLTVRVMNTNGQIVAQQSYTNASYRINMSITNNGSGIYVVQVTDGKGWNESKKITL